ncbi:MAG TPA: ABC transporter ATP-binding protein [Firmicutes bacterium]|jgi:branched-chain amino acid transport system ATP-binding protein|nr:ABC transporter ATP-binding protein [Bacillota bacterium]
MLEVKNLIVNYGAIRALSDVSFNVEEGEIVALIGANGAGKTTILNTISGLLPVVKGQVIFKEMDITKVSPHRIVNLGISHVPEGRRVFPRMSVIENLEMGAFIRKDRARIRKSMDEIFRLFPRLGERKEQMAATLSGGEQQMLAMGRALMAKPLLMLMDEPSMGLAPMLVTEIFKIINDINRSGTTILLVEQNANIALSIANRAFVMETGNIIIQGNANELAVNPAIRKAYLGEE